MMPPESPPLLGRMLHFTTTSFPRNDRFHYWTKDSLCNCNWNDGGSESFDADAIGSKLGPFVLSRRTLRNPATPSYVMIRDQRRIRIDGHDFFRFAVPLTGRILMRATTPASEQKAGELNVIDAAQVNESTVESSDIVSLVTPRDLLPSRTALLHGHLLTDGLGRILRDHILSIFQNMSHFRENELASVAQATQQLLVAAVTATPDAINEASKLIQDALTDRIRRYVDTHLLEPDLTPDRICRDIGVSRAKLYQLFDGEGGIMVQVRRRRLRRAYHALAGLDGRRENIADVAANHGFMSEKYFYRLFKAEFGHTPSETLERAFSGRVSMRGANILLKDPNTQRGWTLPFGALSN